MASSKFGLVHTIGVLCLLVCSTYADLDFSRVHLVDYWQNDTFLSGRSNARTTNFLFRGNMPTVNGSFAYDELLQYMESRVQEANLSWPSDIYLTDISLNNVFDGEDFYHEIEFWKNQSNSALGQFINWPIGTAGVLPPSLYNEAKRKELLNTTVWRIDKIPERIATIRQMLTTPQQRSVAVFVHCSAGCDRTGEMIGSYRIQYELPEVKTVQGMYTMDVQECGRAPDYWSTSALEWFCFDYQYQNNVDIGDCTGFAKCKPFGQCTPTNSSLA